MKVFHITLFDVNMVTGFTEAAYICDLGNGEVTEKHSFQTEESARNWLAGVKRDYIVAMFAKYVNHSYILMETGERGFYKTPAKLSSMDRMKKALIAMQCDSGGTICRFILESERDLRNILPTPSNDSFSSSYERLLNMIVFSKAACGARALSLK